jgi:hypothetical protein
MDHWHIPTPFTNAARSRRRAPSVAFHPARLPPPAVADTSRSIRPWLADCLGGPRAHSAAIEDAASPTIQNWSMSIRIHRSPCRRKGTRKSR